MSFFWLGFLSSPTWVQIGIDQNGPTRPQVGDEHVVPAVASVFQTQLLFYNMFSFVFSQLNTFNDFNVNTFEKKNLLVVDF